MADIRDITIGNQYRGDPNLGGGSSGVFNIDTRPFEMLAQYTFYYNRDLWEENRKITDAKIKEIADLSKIRLNDLRGKDKEQVTKDFVQLQKDAAEYARKIPANEQERLQAELDWQTKKGAFANNYDSGKARSVTYQARLDAINASPKDAKTKDAEIAILNKDFDTTDIGTKISAVEEFKMGTVEIPKFQTQKLNVIGIGANENLSMDATIFNPALNAPKADAAVLGLDKLYPQKGTPEYDKLSPSEKDQADVQGTVQSGSQLWTKMTEPLNESIKKYIDENGNFDAAQFEDDNASNTTLMRAYNALKRYNEDNRTKYQQALSGIYTDKGVSFKLPPTINPNDFKVGFVDFSKGIKPNQLVQAGMYSEYTGDVIEKRLTETDNAIQRAGLAIDWEELGLKRAAANKADDEDLVDARSAINEIAGILNNGVETKVDSPGGLVKVLRISDPVLLQKFGNVDKDGTTTNVPDYLAFNKKTNQLKLGYYTKGGELTKSKGRVIDKEISLDQRTWMNTILDRQLGAGKNKSGVRSILEDVLLANNNSFYEMSQKLNTNQPTQPKQSEGGMTDKEYDDFLKKNGLK